jgi:hypothetical protein
MGGLRRGLVAAGAMALTVALLGLPLAAVGAVPQWSTTHTDRIGSAALTDPAWPVDTRGDGCPSPVWATEAKRSDPRRLLVVGDSLVRESRLELTRLSEDAGWIPTIRCWGAKGTDWGLQQILRARQLKQLPRTVVISLGTNDIWWLGLDLGRGVDAIMSILGSNREVYWVNLHFGPHGYDRLPSPKAANRLLRAKAREYQNLTIVNFARAFKEAKAAGQPVGWQDGVHLNAAGNRERVQAILDAIGTPQRKNRD